MNIERWRSEEQKATTKASGRGRKEGSKEGVTMVWRRLGRSCIAPTVKPSQAKHHAARGEAGSKSRNPPFLPYRFRMQLWEKRNRERTTTMRWDCVTKQDTAQSSSSRSSTRRNEMILAPHSHLSSASSRRVSASIHRSGVRARGVVRMRGLCNEV